MHTAHICVRRALFLRSQFVTSKPIVLSFPVETQNQMEIDRDFFLLVGLIASPARHTVLPGPHPGSPCVFAKTKFLIPPKTRHSLASACESVVPCLLSSFSSDITTIQINRNCQS